MQSRLIAFFLKGFQPSISNRVDNSCCQALLMCKRTSKATVLLQVRWPCSCGIMEGHVMRRELHDMKSMKTRYDSSQFRIPRPALHTSVWPFVRALPHMACNMVNMPESDHVTCLTSSWSVFFWNQPIHYTHLSYEDTSQQGAFTTHLLSIQSPVLQQPLYMLYLSCAFQCGQVSCLFSTVRWGVAKVFFFTILNHCAEGQLGTFHERKLLDVHAVLRLQSQEGKSDISWCRSFQIIGDSRWLLGGGVLYLNQKHFPLPLAVQEFPSSHDPSANPQVGDSPHGAWGQNKWLSVCSVCALH